MSALTGVRLLFNLPQRVQVGFVTLDATISETHTQENEVTAHPIETGAAVTDHIRRRPNEVTLQGVVSSTPIKTFGDVGLLNAARPQAAYEELSRVMRDGELITVATSLRLYLNMALLSFVVDRNADAGRVLACTLRLREVLTVAAQRAIFDDPVDPTDSTQISQGTRPSVPGNTGQSNRASGLKVAADGFLRVFGIGGG